MLLIINNIKYEFQIFITMKAAYRFVKIHIKKKTKLIKIFN